MIDTVLTFLKSHLNEQFSRYSANLESAEDKAVFADTAADGSITFKEGAVNVVMINMEEDRTVRPPEPFRSRGEDGATRRIHPEIPMNLYVLFAARFAEYEQSLVYLSRVIHHFQAHRVITPQNAPTLAPSIGKLTMELHTMTMQQQNDMWSMLKVGYQPSALYRVKMVVFRDEDPREVPVIEQIERKIA
ncbi:MAG: DUF4255 domain-containing protein [Myxococcota bacterium]